MSLLTNTHIRVVPVLDDNYAYIVFDVDKVAFAVDPGEPGPIRQLISTSGLHLDAVLLTHHHGDHAAGAGALQRLFGCRIVSPDSRRVTGTDQMARRDSDFRVGSIRVCVLSLAGHTATHVGYHLPDLEAVFTGDTVFGAGCGRLFEGSPAEMMRSLSTVAALSDQTRIYFGHEYTEENLRFALCIEPDNEAVAARLHHVVELRARNLPTTPSTVALEKRTNPFLRTSAPSLRAAMGMLQATDTEVFTELRKRKDSFRSTPTT